MTLNISLNAHLENNFNFEHWQRDGNFSNNTRDVEMSSTDDVLSQLNFNMTRAVLPVTVFIGVECFVGLFGNIFILLVYSRQGNRSNFCCFVLSMAVIDLTSCLTTLPGEIFSQMNWYQYEHGWICKLKSFFNVFTVWASASLLVGMAFDRYRKICHPLAWQIRQSVTPKLCVVSMIVSAFVASPVIVLWGRQDYLYSDGDLHINVSICEKSGQYANDIYPLLYIICVYIFPIGVMMLVICGLNLFTAKTLFCGMERLRKETSKYSSSTSSFHTVLSNSSLQTSIRELDSDNDTFDRTNLNRTSFTIDSNESPLAKISYAYSQKTKEVESPSVQGIKYTLAGGEHDFINQQFQSILPSSQTTWSLSYPSPSKKTFSDLSESTWSLPTLGQSTPSPTSDSQSPPFHLNFNQSASSLRKFNLSSSTLSGTSQSLSSLDNELRFAPSRDLQSVHSQSKKHNYNTELRRRRKTIIMLGLTTVFVVTMFTYIIMTTTVANSNSALKTATNSEKVVFFFFWRLYFINCLINPILYGFLDPRFRSGMLHLFRRK